MIFRRSAAPNIGPGVSSPAGNEFFHTTLYDMMVFAIVSFVITATYEVAFTVSLYYLFVGVSDKKLSVAETSWRFDEGQLSLTDPGAVDNY